MKKALIAGIFLSIAYAHSSHAQCTSFPYTLTNGQTADANQVMADYTYLANCLASRANPTFSGSVAMSYNGVNHGVLYDDGNFHISGLAGNLWLDAGSNPVAINNQSDGNVFLTNGNGNVGVGTGSPSFPLDVQSTRSGNYTNMGCSTTYGALYPAGSNSFNCTAVTNALVSIRAAGRIVAPEVDAISDMRLKDFVGELEPVASLETIGHLRPLMFTWKPGSGQNDKALKVGFFAQEVATQIPSAVMRGPGVLPDQYFLNYEAIIPYLVSAVQELGAQNRQLKARLDIRSAATGLPSVSDGSNANVINAITRLASGVAPAAPANIKQVTTNEGATKAENDVSALVPTLLAAFKAQQAEIDELKSEVQSFKTAH